MHCVRLLHCAQPDGARRRQHALAVAFALDGVPHTIILEYKKLTKLVVTLNNHPKIKAWNAEKNPKLPWYEPEN